MPDAKAARGSVAWGVLLIGAFFIMTMLVGVGARAILGDLSADDTAGGNLVTPLLAESLGGGEGTLGGDLFLAIISAVAFATILAVVAGLVIAASGAVAHDVWTGVIRRNRVDERDEVRVARIASVCLGVLAIVASILAGETFNVSILVGLAFAVAASANLPALVMALFASAGPGRRRRSPSSPRGSAPRPAWAPPSRRGATHAAAPAPTCRPRRRTATTRSSWPPPW